MLISSKLKASVFYLKNDLEISENLPWKNWNLEKIWEFMWKNLEISEKWLWDNEKKDFFSIGRGGGEVTKFEQSFTYIDMTGSNTGKHDHF